MEHMQVLKGAPIAQCEELINFMLEPATAIAVAEAQSYPPSLDQSKVEMTDAVKALPCYDATGQLESLTSEAPHLRSEERRVGRECVSTVYFRWSRYDKKNKENY